MREVLKPWGRERIFVETSRYAGKIIEIEPRSRLSLQYHEAKDEAVMVLEGVLLLEIVSGERSTVHELCEGDTFHIEPGVIHRMGAGLQRVVFVEVSSPELDDVVRLADDYGREGTTVP
jgi:mannose-6-phosphate isomerase